LDFDCRNAPSLSAPRPSLQKVFQKRLCGSSQCCPRSLPVGYGLDSSADIGSSSTQRVRTFRPVARFHVEADDSVVRIFDAQTGAKLREFGASAAKIEQLAMRPNGEAVATTHLGQRVTLWDGTGKEVLKATGRGQRVSVKESRTSRCRL